MDTQQLSEQALVDLYTPLLRDGDLDSRNRHARELHNIWLRAQKPHTVLPSGENERVTSFTVSFTDVYLLISAALDRGDVTDPGVRKGHLRKPIADAPATPGEGAVS